jgi:hypothetical protein
VIAKPLTSLLKKKALEWSDEATASFLELKQAMISTPVLRLPDFRKLFVVETDACDSGIGAVLVQDQHPIAFLSKPLTKQHLSLSNYDKEFLALLMAVERWRPYLQHAEFLIKTDHQSVLSGRPTAAIPSSEESHGMFNGSPVSHHIQEGS